MRLSPLGLFVALAILAGCSDRPPSDTPAASQDRTLTPSGNPLYGRFAPQGQTHPTRLFVKFKPDISPTDIERVHAGKGTARRRSFRAIRGLESRNLVSPQRLDSVLAEYRSDPRVLYAEPVYQVFAFNTPNDPSWSELWGLNNIGQNSGTPGRDIGALEAWKLTTGSPTVHVGIIDTGVDYKHPDLAANMWINPHEIAANGIDDDGNGYVDDVHGINAIQGTGDPMDDDNHGTHVAGTIAARGNNGVGVTGVNWQATIIGCKFLDRRGSGFLDDAVQCLDYFVDLNDRHGIKIVATNNSWGGGGYSEAIEDAIATQDSHGILFIAAAGNDGLDLDVTPEYPASYVGNNVIAVAATDSKDQIAWFSNYGAGTVHVAAPGVAIFSTLTTKLNRNKANPYDAFDGTSMATPHVTGLAALLKAQDPTRTASQIRELILTGSEEVAGLDTHVIGGRRIFAAGSDGFGSLNCGRRIDDWLTAVSSTHGLGESQSLQVRHQIGCGGAPQGDVTITVSPGGTVLTLKDDGVVPDAAAGDGVYSHEWLSETSGTWIFTKAGGESVAATWSSALTAYLPPSEVPFSYEAVESAPLAFDGQGITSLAAPFPILFGNGPAVSTIHISHNGSVGFSHAHPGTAATLPDASVETLVQAWGDALTPVTGSVSTAVLGSAPNRRLIIDWKDMEATAPACGHGNIRFQLVLFEGNGRLRMNYADTRFGDGSAPCDDGASGIIGVQVKATLATQLTQLGTIAPGVSLYWTPDTPNVAPVADAGPDVTPQAYELLFLDGIQSYDPDGLLVAYAWSQISGLPVTWQTTLANETAALLTPTSGVAKIRLTVTDNRGATNTKEIALRMPTNQPPIADAGATRTITPGTTTILNGGASSDTDGVITNYTWIQTEGLPVKWSTGLTGSIASFTAPASGRPVFRLTVRDDYGDSSETLLVLPLTTNTPPVIAPAPTPKTVVPASTVTLNAAGTTDADGALTSFLWEQLEGPAVALSATSANVTSFVAPATEGTTVTVRLTVTDNQGGTSTADYVVKSAVTPVDKEPVPDEEEVPDALEQKVSDSLVANDVTAPSPHAAQKAAGGCQSSTTSSWLVILLPLAWLVRRKVR